MPPPRPAGGSHDTPSEPALAYVLQFTRHPRELQEALLHHPELEEARRVLIAAGIDWRECPKLFVHPKHDADWVKAQLVKGGIIMHRHRGRDHAERVFWRQMGKQFVIVSEKWLEPVLAAIRSIPSRKQVSVQSSGAVTEDDPDVLDDFAEVSTSGSGPGILQGSQSSSAFSGADVEQWGTMHVPSSTNSTNSTMDSQNSSFSSSSKRRRLNFQDSSLPSSGGPASCQEDLPETPQEQWSATPSSFGSQADIAQLHIAP